MAKTNKTPKAEDNAELRTISLLKILNTYSDENHELSTKNIMDKLQKECGVTVHRTTVGKPCLLPLGVRLRWENPNHGAGKREKGVCRNGEKRFWKYVRPVRRVK